MPIDMGRLSDLDKRIAKQVDDKAKELLKDWNNLQGLTFEFSINDAIYLVDKNKLMSERLLALGECVEECKEWIGKQRHPNRNGCYVDEFNSCWCGRDKLLEAIARLEEDK